ncbi:MAG: hemagglutinin repeat-containing protein [Planctomycetaceae bacterium]
MTSTGAITDATGASLDVTNNATLTGVGITLADQATDTLTIGGTADLEAGSGAIIIGPAGTANFGSLTFNSTSAVSIQEDSATNLTGANTANSLSLTSTGAITDATGALLNVTNNGTFTGIGITLADQATDTLTVGGTADFESGSGAITIGPAGAANFGSLTFNSTNAVSIQEDSATNLTGSSTANSLSLTSTGAITDATGTSVNVTNNGTFTGVGITLADQATDTLSVGGTADFEAGTGAIIIGPAGTANFGSLTFNSTSSVSVQEDSATNLTGSNTAETARIWSVSDVTQSLGSSVTVETFAVTSDAGNIVLASDLNDVDNFAAQATNLGAGGKTVDFVDLDGFNVANLAVDGAFPTVQGINVTTQNGSTIRLRSGGDITQDSDAPVIADQLAAQATGDIDLCMAPNDVNTLAAKAGGNVSFKDANTFTLGTVIDDGSGTLTAPITGVSGIDIDLIANDSLVVNIAINTTGKVRLISLNGSITQTASITAQSLAVQARDFVDLSTQINHVDVFAATATLQHVYYRDADAVTIGQVLNDTDCPDVVDVTGVTAGTHVEIRGGTSIVVNQQVSAGDAVRLLADNGTVTQSATGVISANQLSVQAFGTGSLIDLNNATNNVRNFVATTLGDIDFLNKGTLTINADAGGAFVTSPVTGVTATGGGDVSIQTNDNTSGDGDLTVLQPINSTGATFGTITLTAEDSVVLSANVGNSNTPSVLVTAQNGSISQTTGLVAGDAVTMTAGTSISQTGAQIEGNNTVELSAGTSITQSSGTITAADISLDAGTSIAQNTNSEITATNGVTLTAGTDISQSASSIAGTNTVDLTAGGDITQSSGTVTGNIVTLQAGADIAQDTNSAITGNTSVTMTAGGSITQSASQITGPTVTLTAGSFIGATGAIIGLSAQQYNDGTAPGSTPNFADWTTLLNDNGNEIQVNTNALTATASGGDARINVNPLTTNVEITITAAGNVILTSLNANTGTLNANQITAGQNILLYTESNSVALGSLYTLQTTANSLVVDTGGTLSQLSNYRIATGNTASSPTNVLLQLLPNGIFPTNPPADASTNGGLSAIYSDYNFFQVQSPYPSPNEAVIRPMQDNSITARYGIAGETGWHNTIDWGDGTAPQTDPTGPDGALPQQAGGGVYTYSHLYQTTADATYNVNLTVSVDQSISLASHVGTDAPTFYLTRVLETKVVVNTVPPPPVFFMSPDLAPPTRVEVFYVQPASATPPMTAAQAELKLVESSTAVAEKRRFLQLWLVPEDNTEEVAIPVSSDGIKALNKEIDLEILQGDRLIETFKTLPDGRYRLMLYRTLGDEVLDERTVLETVITNGVPSNPLDEVIEQLRRQLDRESESENDEKIPGGAEIEFIETPAAPEVSHSDDAQGSGPSSAAAVGLLGSTWNALKSHPDRKPDPSRRQVLSR